MDPTFVFWIEFIGAIAGILGLIIAIVQVVEANPKLIQQVGQLLRTVISATPRFLLVISGIVIASVALGLIIHFGSDIATGIRNALPVLAVIGGILLVGAIGVVLGRYLVRHPPVLKVVARSLGIALVATLVTVGGVSLARSFSNGKPSIGSTGVPTATATDAVGPSATETATPSPFLTPTVPASASAFFAAGYSAFVPGPCDSAHKGYWSAFDDRGTYNCDNDRLTMKSLVPYVNNLVPAVYFYGPANEATPPSFQIRVRISPADSHSCAYVGFANLYSPYEEPYTNEFGVCGDGNWSYAPFGANAGGALFGSVSPQSWYALTVSFQHGNADFSINGSMVGSIAFDAGVYSGIELTAGTDVFQSPPPPFAASFQSFTISSLA